MRSRCRTSSKTSSASSTVSTPRAARRRILQLGPVQPRQLHPVAEPEAVLRPDEDALVDLEVLHQDVQHAPRHPPSTCSIDGAPCRSWRSPWSTVSSRSSASSSWMTMSVSRTTRNRCAPLHGRPGNSACTLAQTTSSRNTNATRRPRQLGRQRQEARHDRRQLDARELRAAVVLDDDREVLAQVRDVRERVAGVERERRQHRRDLAREIAARYAEIAGE